MYRFDYQKPADLTQAASLVAAGGQALAGGQTLLASMKQRLIQPEALVDLASISSLVGISEVDGQVQIGAMTRHAAVATTALEPGELITAVRFPVPQRAGYAKFKQPASRYAVVGVFVAQFASGVRVAVTGAGNGVFRHAGLEAALTASFSAAAVEGVSVDSADLNGDLHASADYRAQLILVQTQRAVEQALG